MKPNELISEIAEKISPEILILIDQIDPTGEGAKAIGRQFIAARLSAFATLLVHETVTTTGDVLKEVLQPTAHKAKKA